MPLWLQGDEKKESMRSNGNARQFGKNSNMSSGADGSVNESNGNKRNPNSARSRGGNISARGDQSARRKKDSQDNGGGENRSGLGIVGSGMSVSGNRVRTIPRDQDKYQ